MHYWVRRLCRMLTKQHSVRYSILVFLAVFVAVDANCCDEDWCNSNNEVPFILPNGNNAGVCPPGIFNGGFVGEQPAVQGQHFIPQFPQLPQIGPTVGLPFGPGSNVQTEGSNSFVGPPQFPNNNNNGGGNFPVPQPQKGSDGLFVGPPQFPNNNNNGGNFPVPQSQRGNDGLFIGPPQFPNNNNNNGGNFPVPQPQKGSDGLFVGVPSPFPQQPVGPLRPQINNNNGFDVRGNQWSTVTSTGNQNTRHNEDPDLVGLKHPFELHIRRRRLAQIVQL